MIPDQVLCALAERYGTPSFVYDEGELVRRASAATSIPLPDLVVRYAMKANPHSYFLRLFDSLGLHIDASSSYEAERAIAAGIAPEKIRLTSQELPGKTGLQSLARQGCLVTASSLHQLAQIGEALRGARIAIRFNTGVDAGGNPKVDTAGPLCGFGVWHEDVTRVHALAKKYGLIVECIHTHIGSGTDPGIWTSAARRTVQLAQQFPTVTTINLGGGFKVARMPGEKETDIVACGEAIKQEIGAYKLELEPGTFLVANAGFLLARVIDEVKTSTHHFLKLDAGMTELARPTMYGAQHHITRVGEASGEASYVIIGHCCESSDLFTCDPNDSAQPVPRTLPVTKPGDLLLIHGVGAYCAAMSFTGYNSFPRAAEIVVKEDGVYCISRRGSVQELVQHETIPS
ncbi:diaminopimelate decarboxylase [Candidatus Woesearchaeota archaeon]|nr:MAG: diaminopimelate decarboxylase [Candidatus Woesearchaeota archaeon]